MLFNLINICLLYRTEIQQPEKPTDCSLSLICYTIIWNGQLCNNESNSKLNGYLCDNVTMLLRNWLSRKCVATWAGSRLNRMRLLLCCSASISRFSSLACKKSTFINKISKIPRKNCNNVEFHQSVPSLYMYKYTGPGWTQSCIYSEVNNTHLFHFISTKENSYNTHL